jgi:hypothetical protein
MHCAGLHEGLEHPLVHHQRGGTDTCSKQASFLCQTDCLQDVYKQAITNGINNNMKK